MKQILVLAIIYILAVNWSSVQVLLAGEINYDPELAGPVTLYSTSWCGYCKKTRAFLEKNNIPYTEFDVEKSGDAMRQITTMNAYGVPVVVVGDTVIRGYQLAALAKALDSD